MPSTVKTLPKSLSSAIAILMFASASLAQPAAPDLAVTKTGPASVTAGTAANSGAPV